MYNNRSRKNSRNYNHNNDISKEISTPYNFVPLSEKVVFPDWADKVSHDVPFSDSVSGILNIELETKTPIYIRNGGAWNENDMKDSKSSYNDFFQTKDGLTYIPGTSLKGAIRNIFEIITFSKMSKVNEIKYAIRDLNNKEYTSKMTKKSGVIIPQVKAGWLTKNNDGEWEIIPCEYARVEHSLLDNEFGKNKESGINKYKRYKKKLEVNFSILSNNIHKHSCGDIQYNKVDLLGMGNLLGTLVFTGQPMERSRNRRTNKMQGKHMEFIFYNPKNNKIQNVNQLKKGFIFVHTDDKENPNEEWGYWKRKMNNGEKVPVFYLTDSKGRIESFGLAMMYRLPCDNSTHDAIKNTSKHHFSNKKDFAEILFGDIKDNEALKGRVQFGHLKTEKQSTSIGLIKTVLGSPKASYYPNYLIQDEKALKQFDHRGRLKPKYKTFMTPNVQIRGWKKYPVRQDTYNPGDKQNGYIPNIPVDGNGRINMDVATTFKPLQAGSCFIGKIRFHNLKKVELGALIWSLTLGNNSDLRHNIGMGKGLGFGSIKLKIVNLNEKMQRCLNEFINYMNNKVEKWIETDQLCELLAMTNPKLSNGKDFKYPILGMKRNENDFVNFKKNGKFLKSYSGKKFENNITSLSSSDFQNGDIVECIVLEETTKKGNHKLKIIGGKDSDKGLLIPKAKGKTPDDFSVGKKYKMKLFSYSPNNCQFDWA